MLKVVILGKSSRSTKMLNSVLKSNGFDTVFIEEQRDNNYLLIKNRIKRFGFFKVFGQLFFQVFSRIQASSKYTKARLNSIQEEIVEDLIALQAEHVVVSVNDNEVIQHVLKLAPDCIILSGTRLLSNDFLNAMSVPIVNIHAGITPKYRGVHGGYWSLAEGDFSNFGSTIHIVDAGIDTGHILAQARPKVSHLDNFSTYPLLQMRAALELLPEVLESLLAGTAEKKYSTCDSKLWSHPTIWEYIWIRMTKNVK
ncbi:TPA: hypothetical protein I7745_19300 [Vibrio vulnificus]|nr:hypothetical protein [Vibrio vulnificus]